MRTAIPSNCRSFANKPVGFALRNTPAPVPKVKEDVSLRQLTFGEREKGKITIVQPLTSDDRPPLSAAFAIFRHQGFPQIVGDSVVF